MSEVIKEQDEKDEEIVIVEDESQLNSAVD